MKTAHKISVSLALSATLLTAACSSEANSASTGSAASDSNASGSAGNTITVTDQRGQEISIEQPVEKIASAVIPAPTIIAAVDGSWDRIVGINESLLQSNQEGIIGDIFPASKTSEVVSDRTFAPNMESILALDPDVMIQWGDRSEDVIAPIEQAGISTLGLQYGTQEDLETWIELFGDVLDKPERADMLLELMDQEEREIKEKVSKIDGPSPRAMSLSYSEEKLSVDNSADYAQHVYDITGLTNVAKDSQAEDGVVNAEQILEWDPEIIFLSSFDKATPEDVYSDPRLADVTAVKEKRVYRSPLGVYRWQVPCAESPLYWNWVAELAYQGKFESDLPQKMRELIQEVYNYDIDDADIDLVLRNDLNEDSANYDLVNS